MTERFKKAVSNVVRDGIVTDEEEKLILKIAKEEGICEDEAKVYLIGEKKKINAKSGRKSNWHKTFEVIAVIGGAVVTVAGGAFKVLEVITAANDAKDNKFRTKKVVK